MKQDDIIRQYMSTLGKRSAAKLTPEERTERARLAVKKKWELYKANKENKT